MPPEETEPRQYWPCSCGDVLVDRHTDRHARRNILQTYRHRKARIHTGHFGAAHWRVTLSICPRAQTDRQTVRHQTNALRLLHDTARIICRAGL